MLSMRTRFSVSDVHHHNGFSVQFEYVSFPCYLGEPSTCNGTETRENRCLLEKIVEARVGIEPTYKGFADLSLTTWVPRLIAAWKKPRGCGAPPWKFGAGDGGRTRDIDLGKVALYH